MNKITVSLDDIQNVTTMALTSHGAHDWIAHEVALAVRKAEATGNLICGLYYLESYCKQLLTGRVNGVIEPVVSQPRNAIVKVDAGFGFAQAAFTRALPKALAATKQAGTCSSGRLPRSHMHISWVFHRADSRGRIHWNRFNQCISRGIATRRQSGCDWHQSDRHVCASQIGRAGISV